MYRKYEKIKGFKEMISDIRFLAKQNNIVSPVVSFYGTTKVHGTNACLMYDGKKLVGGKRTSFLDPTMGKEKGHDHFGFTQWVQDNREALTSFMESNFNAYCEDGERLYVYGEWAGKGVQKLVAVSELEKSFFVFDAVIETDDKDVWLSLEHIFPLGTRKPVENMYNIEDFGKIRHDVDFSKLQDSQNFFHKITMEVEENCPVAHRFGINGIGEGLVWTAYFEGQKINLKTKGPKHSVHKTKNIAPIDEVKLSSVMDFVDYAATKNRIEQGIMEVGATSMQQMGALIKWVSNDIIDEESKALEANGLVWKDVAREVSNRIRQQLHEHINRI